PVEGGAAGEAAGQGQERPQPVAPGEAEPLDLLEAVGTADDGAERNGQDVVEPVLLGPIDAWVGQVGEIPGEVQRALGHGGASLTPAYVWLNPHSVRTSRCVDPAPRGVKRIGETNRETNSETKGETNGEMKRIPSRLSPADRELFNK